MPTRSIFVAKVLLHNMLKQVYLAYVQSVLQYGILGWGGTYKSTIQPLQISKSATIWRV